MPSFTVNLESFQPNENLGFEPVLLGRLHQTALFINVSIPKGYNSSAFRNRVTRLLESLNEPGMMADIFLVSGTRVIQISKDSILDWSLFEPFEMPTELESLNYGGLRQWAAAQSYAMVLFATNA